MRTNSKHIFKALTLALTLGGVGSGLTSCSDWLNLLPNSEKVTDEFWQTKEDVEAVVASGYYYMRQSVPNMLRMGELRASTLYDMSASTDYAKMQNFDMLASNSMANYSNLYQIVNMANSVIRYSGDVQDRDNTYYDALRQSHLCEALFQRAYAYSIMVKNWKEVPLIVQAYVTDDADFRMAKSSESEIIAQIKADCLAALATGSAKASYEEEWETKGRVTKWALYALLTDICLWNHEYDEAVKYADMILQPKDALHPAFIKDMNNWFEIFYPGNSNESIFELNWDYAVYGEKNNFTTSFGFDTYIMGGLNASTVLKEKYVAETQAVLANHPELSTDGRVGRMFLSTFITGAGAAYNPADNYFSLWKYRGSDVAVTDNYRNNSNWDANFILYRVADIKLMKAEALIMKGENYWMEAVAEINDIRNRAGLPDYIDLSSETAEQEVLANDQLTLLTEVLDQREMEFVGEGKRWYDLLRMARYDSTFAPEGTLEDLEEQEYETYHKSGFGQDEFLYKEQVITLIQNYNTTVSDMQLKSVLLNSWAWYLPLPQSDIESNDRLVQNPYYKK